MYEKHTGTDFVYADLGNAKIDGDTLIGEFDDNDVILAIRSPEGT